MSDKSTLMSNRLETDRPIRGADRNQNLVDRTDPTTDDLLPSLDDSITLLDIDGSRGVPILQSLVLDHLLLHDGPIFWVDANGHATTTTFAHLAPSQRLLDRITVARGFTAYQHYGTVSDLPTAVNQSIERTSTTDVSATQSSDSDGESSPHTPALIVVPAVDAHSTVSTTGETHAATIPSPTTHTTRRCSPTGGSCSMLVRNRLSYNRSLLRIRQRPPTESDWA